MTKKKQHRGQTLSRQILGLLAVTLLISVVLMQILSYSARGIIENILFLQDILLTETQYADLNDWIFNLSLLVSVIFFILLFLFLLGERLSYINDILKGIDALQQGNQEHTVPIEGHNELTQLATSVNYLSATQKQIKEKEQALAEEKEQLTRSLSHDIRTPLTSILSYTELLAEQPNLPRQTQGEYLHLIHKKAEQIRDLTEILLGSNRKPEYIQDARLLMEQLIAEMEDLLEDTFALQADLSACPAFAGTFDISELRRITDNLVSNIQKYADPTYPVLLSIKQDEDGLVLHQENAVLPQQEAPEGYHIGISSIRRIAQHYGGHAEIRQTGDRFAITITLREF